MTVDDWHDRVEVLRGELVSAGKLTSQDLQAAMLGVPRHVFVPEFFERRPGGGWDTISGTDEATRQRWLERIYANTSLVTQVGAISNDGRDQTGPTSSSSAPGLMTRMIEALDLRPGHRVLEIGTGTGYNAALMSRQLGDTNVYSVDIDPEMVENARARLAGLGYHPTLRATDGAAGMPEAAPYDRIIATCAVSWVPWAWAEQVTDGGAILVDVKIHAVVGNLVLLRRDGSQLAGRFDPGAATFMHMRTPAFESDWTGGPARDRETARRRSTACTLERLWELGTLWFLIHLRQPGRVDFGYTMDKETNAPDAVFFTGADGSWCEVTLADGDTRRDVWEAGPRRLWADIEAAIEQWEDAGRPDWNRFGLTVTSTGEQTVWLDEPGSPHRWPLTSRQPNTQSGSCRRAKGS